MALSTFSEVKAEILLRASKLETCILYNRIMQCEDTLSLLKVCCGLYLWAYQNNVVSDDMFSIFGESDLNKYGIYTTGSYTLTDPDGFDGCHDYTINQEDIPPSAQELFFANDVIVTLNISSDHRYSVKCLGTSQVIINVGDGAFCNILASNQSEVTVNISGTGNICIDSNEDAQVAIDATNQALTRGRLFSRSTISYVGHDGSTAFFSAFMTSTLNYALNDLSTIEVLTYNRSTINSV